MTTSERARETLREVNDLAIRLVEVGLVDFYNPAVVLEAPGETLVTPPVPVDATVLKSKAYAKIYSEQLDRNAFNYRFLDGAIAQLSYTFDAASLVSHRLSYLPSPDLEAYQSDPELYIMGHPYLDVVGAQVVSVPLRFDYDARPGVAVPGLHPVSHFTLGQYQNCRVPVSGPATPAAFVDFITRAFYSTELGLPITVPASAVSGFGAAIHAEDLARTHMAVPAT